MGIVAPVPVVISPPVVIPVPVDVVVLPVPVLLNIGVSLLLLPQPARRTAHTDPFKKASKILIRTSKPREEEEK